MTASTQRQSPANPDVASRFFFFVLFITSAVVFAQSGFASVRLDPPTVSTGKEQTVTLTLRNAPTNAQIRLVPGGPHFTGEVTFPAAARHVAANPRYAYVTLGRRGLAVVDLRRKSDAVIGTLPADAGFFDHIVLADQTVVIANQGQGLWFVDVSQPQYPRLTGVYSITDRILSMAHSGTDIALVTENRMLITVEFENFAEPQLVARRPLRQAEVQLALDQGHLFLGYGEAVELVSFRNLIPLDRIRLTQPISRIAAGNGLLILANEGGEISLFDHSNPRDVSWAGSYSRGSTITHLALTGRQLLAIDDAETLLVFDLHDLRHPTVSRTFANFHDSGTAVLTDDRVISLQDHRLRVLSIRPQQPAFSNENLDAGQGVNFGGQRKADLEGDTLYVADWFSGIHLYDVSDPPHPRLISSVHTPGSSKGVAAQGGYLFVADDDHGLQVVDVREPSQARIVADLPLNGLAYTPVVRGHHLYMASHRGGFQIIDVSDPLQPRLISQTDTLNKAWSIDVAGDIAFVADAESGLLIYDVREKKAPRLIGQFNPGGNAEDVIVENNIAYVAFFDLGLFILDVSDPQQPRSLGHLPTPGHARGIAKAGDRVFVADWHAGVQLVDVANLRQPKLLAGFDTEGAAWGVRVQDDHVYVLDWWGGLQILQTDPRRQYLRWAGNYQQHADIVDIAGTGSFLFVAYRDRGLQVYDIKNPLNPTWATGLELEGRLTDFLATGQTVIAASVGGGIYQIDVSDPFRPVVRNRYRQIRAPVALDRFQHWLFALDQEQGLIRFRTAAGQLAELSDPISTPASQLSAVDAERVLLVHDKRLLLADIQRRKTRLLWQAEENIVRVLPWQTDRRLIVTESGSIFSLSLGEFDVERRYQPPAPLSVTAAMRRENTLFLASDNKELHTFSLRDHSRLQFRGKIQLSTPLQTLIAHQGYIYGFRDAHLVAFKPFPDIRFQPAAHHRFITRLPGNLPEGTYDVLISNGTETIRLHDLLSIEAPRFGKPDISQEEFKALLEQRRQNSGERTGP